MHVEGIKWSPSGHSSFACAQQMLPMKNTPFVYISVSEVHGMSTAVNPPSCPAPLVGGGGGAPAPAACSCWFGGANGAPMTVTANQSPHHTWCAMIGERGSRFAVDGLQLYS